MLLGSGTGCGGRNYSGESDVQPCVTRVRLGLESGLSEWAGRRGQAVTGPTIESGGRRFCDGSLERPLPKSKGSDHLALMGVLLGIMQPWSLHDCKYLE